MQDCSQSRNLRPDLRMEAIAGCGWQRDLAHIVLGLYMLRWKTSPLTQHLSHRYMTFAHLRQGYPKESHCDGRVRHWKWPASLSSVSDQHPMPVSMKCYRRFFWSIHTKKYSTTVKEHEVGLHMLPRNADLSIIKLSEMQNHKYGITLGCKNRQAKRVWKDMQETLNHGHFWGQAVLFFILSCPVWVLRSHMLIAYTIRIPWTKEPGRPQSIRSQRVGHNWNDLARIAYTVFLKWMNQIEERNVRWWETGTLVWVRFYPLHLILNWVTAFENILQHLQLRFEALSVEGWSCRE